jgi:hypothetical protein
MPAIVKKSVLIFALALLLFACTQEAPPAITGSVEANSAYLYHFGKPPAVKAGKAFARVGYLPLREQHYKLGAVPLYLFDKNDQLPRLLDRLVSGDLTLPPDSPLYNPFPPDTQVRVAANPEKVLTLSLYFAETASYDPTPMTNALVETAAQLDDIERVIVLLNGRAVTGMPEAGFTSDRKRIIDVAPPALIMIAGIWDEGEAALEEIAVNFDRPITVNSFSLSHADGTKVLGDYFVSAFQMSVVVHPETPGIFQDGTVLQVQWEVVDALGRVGQGRQVLPLRRFVHEVRLGEFIKK